MLAEHDSHGGSLLRGFATCTYSSLLFEKRESGRKAAVRFQPSLCALGVTAKPCTPLPSWFWGHDDLTRVGTALAYVVPPCLGCGSCTRPEPRRPFGVEIRINLRTYSRAHAVTPCSVAGLLYGRVSTVGRVPALVGAGLIMAPSFPSMALTPLNSPGRGHCQIITNNPIACRRSRTRIERRGS